MIEKKKFFGYIILGVLYGILMFIVPDNLMELFPFILKHPNMIYFLFMILFIIHIKDKIAFISNEYIIFLLNLFRQQVFIVNILLLSFFFIFINLNVCINSIDWFLFIKDDVIIYNDMKLTWIYGISFLFPLVFLLWIYWVNVE